MSDDLVMEALLAIDEKVARVVRDGYPLDAAALRVVEGKPEIRINLGLTEAELRVVAWALAAAVEKREEAHR